MKRAYPILLIILSILLVAGSCRVSPQNDSNRSTPIAADEENQDVEKIALQIWDLLYEKRFDDLPLAVDGLVDPENVETLREQLSQPIDFDWKIVRGESGDLSTDYHYFISLPRYINDPERRPFAQINCTLNSRETEKTITKLSILFKEEVDQKKFDKMGVSPGMLSLKEQYEIKNRTIRSVLDSLQAAGVVEDPVLTLSSTLERLEKDEKIEQADAIHLIRQAFSENQFYLFKILLPYYNENRTHYGGVKLEDVNYLLREGMLKQIDFLMTSDFTVEYNAVYTEDGCDRTPTEAFSSEAAEAIRSLIMEAELEAAIDRFQGLNIPDPISDRMALYCSTNKWIEQRYPLVRSGVESYRKLSTMNSIMIANMLSDLSALEN